MDLGTPSIEGEQILVCAKNIRRNKRQTVIAGEGFFTFDALASASAELEKIYADMSGKPKYFIGAMLTRGSKLNGVHISIFAKDYDERDKGGPGRTSAHTGHFQYFKEEAFAIIFKAHGRDTIRGDPVRALASVP